MNKVITINLNGKAYQLEESGYQALQEYLEQAEDRLRGNIDKDEVMKDFEQALSEKCDQYLAPGKTVITTREIEKIIADMGPVNVDFDGSQSSAQGSTADDNSDKRNWRTGKRLYKIPEGSWIAGVSSGLAVFFDIDVAIVRVIFVVLAFATHSFMVLVYILLMILIPTARTPEQRAEARGENFNANDVLEKARRKYAAFTANHERWRSGQNSRKSAREERKQARRDEKIRRQYSDYSTYTGDWSRHPGFGAGLAAAILNLILTALFLLWIAALWSVVVTGTVFGNSFGFTGTILSMAILLTLAYFVISVPLKSAARSVGWHRQQRTETFSWIIWVAAIAAFIFIAFTYSAQLKDFSQRQYGHYQVAHHTVCVGDSNYCKGQ